MVDFYDLWDDPPAKTPAPVIQLTPREPREGLHPYAAAAVAGELGRLDALPRPWREGVSYWDDTTFQVACNLIELANSPWTGYSLDQAEYDLRAHAPSDGSWGPRQHEEKWSSAWKKVGTQGRPEPTPRPADTFTVTTLTEVQQVSVSDAEDDDPLGRFNLIDWAQLKREEDTGEEWLYEPLIAAGRMTALFSAPKAGKSLLILEIAAAIALGRPVLGTPAGRPANVLYIDFENDPRGDIKPRLEDMGYDLDDLTGHLHVATFPSMARLDTPQGGMDLLWLATEVEAELVIIDTVSRTVGGEENDNNTWLNFYRNTGVHLKRAGIACVRLDHSGKDTDKGMRGGSAKYGDVDLVWRLTAPSETVIHLDCTDHRMRLDNTHLELVRETRPQLHHRVAVGNERPALDALEKEVDALLDRLHVPSTASVREAKKAVREAGHKVQNAAIERAVKARKMRLHEPPQQVSPGHPRDTAGRSELSPPVPPSRKGRDGGHSDDAPGRDGDRGQAEPDEIHPRVVSCKACYRPVDHQYAHEHNGRCERCAENLEDR